MSSEIEYKNYGPHRYARVDNLDDILEVLLRNLPEFKPEDQSKVIQFESYKITIEKNKNKS